MKKTSCFFSAAVGYGRFNGPAPAFGLAWLVLHAALVTAAGADTFTNTGPLNNARSAHTATRLLDGKVLVAGGFFNGSSLASAELYDPATGVWTATGNLPAARNSHTATLLPDGRVLVAGGSSGGALTNAALYYPATGFWTNTGPLATGRYSHTAVLLPNGKVLVAGGTVGPLASAELYDPATGLWTNTDDLTTAREAHTATLLPNGLVLAAAGSSGSTRFTSAELYAPATGLWTNTTGPLGTARTTHAAALLANGKVLVTGGTTTGGVHLNGAELYDPATSLWSTTGAFATARRFHTATLLPNGLLLITGGLTTGGAYVAGAELYNQGFGTWSATGPLAAPRCNHTATLLANGKVLVVGGVTTGGAYLASAELYDPAGVVVTLPATGNGSINITLNGSANPRGLPTSAWFEWGATTNYGQVTLPQAVGIGQANTNVSQIIGGVAIGGTYHFRAVASNSLGTTFGADRVFFIPTFQSIWRLANGEVETRINGPTNAAYLMEASTNLINWKLIAALHASNSPALFQDPETGRFAQRFYRYRTFRAFQTPMFYFLDSEIGNEDYLFRHPSHSSTTAIFIDTTMGVPNSVRVANLSFSGGSPANGLHVSWSFANGAVNPWVRLDTFNSQVYPNPIIEFSKGLCFDIYTDRDFYVALGLRETNPVGAVGENGGTTGPIEWVGGTVNSSVSPPLGRLVTAGKWQRLCFYIPAEPVRAFTGNGVLESTTGTGVIEHLVLVPANYVPSVTNNIYLGNFQTLEPMP